MRARELAQPYPFVNTHDSALDAARMMAKLSLPALLVLDTDGQPHAIVPGSQLVRQILPFYLIEDPLLAAVDDGQHDADLVNRLTGHTVAEWAPCGLYPPPVVAPDAPPIQVAVLMARTHVPLVAVVEDDGDNTTLLGLVTAAQLMRYFTESPQLGVRLRRPSQPRAG